MPAPIDPGWLAAYQRARPAIRCGVHDQPQGCPEHAVGWLYAPDGRANPGGAVCWAHAAVALSQDPSWTVRELWEHCAAAATARASEHAGRRLVGEVAS